MWETVSVVSTAVGHNEQCLDGSEVVIMRDNCINVFTYHYGRQ